MVKPRLPQMIEKKLSPEILHHIYEFVPHLHKEEQFSPSLQRELFRIQNLRLNGKDSTYMRGLIDFTLD